MINRSEEDITKNWDRSLGTVPLVSVRCLVYNHEKYVEECLDGFLMQETNFPFEIVIHDDASTDNSAGIIKKYEAKYPNIINALYESENLYSKKDGSLSKLLNNTCRGRYIAFCEGDDYWTDPQKLQMQFDTLEKHQECSFCACLVECCEADGTRIPRTFPKDGLIRETDNGVISQSNFVKMIASPYYPFHTSSYFIRRECLFKTIPGITSYFVRDAGIMLKCALVGDACYINRPMSMRRFGAYDSWNSRLKRDGKKAKYKLHIADYLMFMSFDKVTGGMFRDYVFPCAFRHLGLVIIGNRKKATELAGRYKELVGINEFSVRYKLFVKEQPMIKKILYYLFEHGSFLIDLLSVPFNLFVK